MTRAVQRASLPSKFEAQCVRVDLPDVTLDQVDAGVVRPVGVGRRPIGFHRREHRESRVGETLRGATRQAGRSQSKPPPARS